MYPRIYKRNETDFSHNGYGVLKDLIKCEVIEEDNGMFEFEGECTISSFLFDYIQEENIIKAWASEELGEQLFRIYRVQKSLDGYITFNAQHISYDLLDNFIESIELVDTTCENAINEIFNHCAYKTPFKGYSDITHKGNIILQRVNPMEAIKGTRGSICDTFGNGAKVIKDNFDIKVMANRGFNNNVLIAYKKNLTGFESEIDTSDLVTVIFPYATIQTEGDEEGSSTDEIIQLPEKYIYSQYHQNYNNLKIMPIDFSGDDVKDIESLRTKAKNYFKNSNCDIPKVNYKVEFVPLSKTINYSDYKVLETVSMCDKVIVRDSRFNLDVEAEVIKTTHCSLTKKLLSCELGNFKYSLSDVVSDINKEQVEISDKIDKIKVNIDNELGKIQVNIKDQVSKLESNIELTAEKLESKFTDADKGLQSQITQNAESITQRVTSNEFESYKKQTADQISQKVSAGDVSSIIQQDAESVKIGFNNISDSFLVNEHGILCNNTNGNKSIAIQKGNLYYYNQYDNSKFLGGIIPRITTNDYLKGFGVLASKHCNTFQISHTDQWDNDSQWEIPGTIYPDFWINYKDITSYRGDLKGIHLGMTTYVDDNILGNKSNFISGFNSIGSTSSCFDYWRSLIDNSIVARFDGGTNQILLGKNLNGNGFVLENFSSINSSNIYLDNVYAYNGNYGRLLFRTNGWDMFNGANWDWQGYNILNPRIVGGVYGYSAINNSTKSCKIDNVDDVLDSINIIVEDVSTCAEGQTNSLEIDVSQLINHPKADLFIDKETNNVNMKSMLHLALLEIQKLKKECMDLRCLLFEQNE